MRLIYALCTRYDRTPDGACWIKTGPAYQFWTRYLEVFDSVRIVGRVRDVPAVSPGSMRIDGEGVSVAAIPNYLGPWQYILRARAVARASREAFEVGDAVILYAGSSISGAIEAELRRMGYPYAIWVGGDPYDAFAPGSIRHPARPLLRWLAPRYLRAECARAPVAIYVTGAALQRRYPCPGHTVAVSDVDLPEQAFSPRARAVRKTQGPFTAVMVGTLAQLYKAPDVLIDAISICVRNGIDVRLRLVGEGKYQPRLQAQSRSLGIDDRVVFAGAVPAGPGVWAELDQADLFILASHQEGLPRAMVEAMARGLPCIGSTAGGIPELLPARDLVRPGDATALAAKISEVLRDPKRMSAMSERNLEKAGEFREECVRGRRLEYLTHLKEATEQWMSGHGSRLSARDAPVEEAGRV